MATVIFIDITRMALNEGEFYLYDTSPDFFKRSRSSIYFFCKSYSPKEVEWEDTRGGKVEGTNDGKESVDSGCSFLSEHMHLP